MLISACRLVMLYTCAMFHEMISNGIKVIEWTQFLLVNLQRGIIPPKNAGGATLVNLCTSSVMFYISTKFCDIISNGIKVIE